ncbi:ATPase family associated with various cellular activities (AAA) [Methylobacterium phyllostachyos]|uniref:ATPase family associated with various cellular activities (AAA) n=1 Tax=Methylobacterium phyllostachyos TaxID=582672 RepID=A0A1G9TYZ8_9HYPH|nr:AAA family ATPase [Methylobacterium phyllostachyos]SDM52979.1 ATPase family associated with various cellular activities (AAA) [Methylobacterium phyllostachyos]
MSDDTKRLAAWARLRAVILNPVLHCGPREPMAPIDRGDRLRGGEFVQWDARVDAQAILRRLQAYELPDDLSLQIARAIERPTVGKLRRLRQALRRDVPQGAEFACRDADNLLVFNIAALGCPAASAECAAAALDSAVMHIGSGDGTDSYEKGHLAFRAACLWACDAQADATDVEYKPGPLYSRLAAFDQRARFWLASFAVIAKAEDAIAAEDDILRGGAGMKSDLSQLVDLPPVPEDWDKPGSQAARPAQTLVVIPSLRHLPKPSTGAIDRGDSPRALAEPWAEKPMPLVRTPDPAAFAAAMRARFPWASEAIEQYAMDLVGAPFARFRPRILVGGPGLGKTAFARAILEEAGLGVTVYSAAGQMDGGSYAGTSRQWGSWRLSVPAQACLRFGQANHGVVVDEVEKAGNSRRWGRLDETILPYLETTARAIHDPALECALDLSAVSHILTANSLTGIVTPLLDRAPPIHWPAPRAEDLPIVAAALLADLRRDRGFDATWCPDLDGEELDALTAWRGGSLRPLRRMIEKIVASRDILARRMPN